MCDPSLYHRPFALDSIRTESVDIHDVTSGMVNTFMTQLALSETVGLARKVSNPKSPPNRNNAKENKLRNPKP